MIGEKMKKAASHLNECRGSDQTRTRRRDSMILGILTSVGGLSGATQPPAQPNKMSGHFYVRRQAMRQPPKRQIASRTGTTTVSNHYSIFRLWSPCRNTRQSDLNVSHFPLFLSFPSLTSSPFPSAPLTFPIQNFAHFPLLSVSISSFIFHFIFLSFFDSSPSKTAGWAPSPTIIGGGNEVWREREMVVPT